jgi:molybdopterin converting factor small subunit
MAVSSMRVRVVSFGPLKALFAEGGEVFEVRVGESVGGLITMLRAAGRVDDAALRCAAIAVDHEYAAMDVVLRDGDEVAILPPVSGGTDALVRLVRGPEFKSR